jgi:hypothetical protein
MIIGPLTYLLRRTGKGQEYTLDEEIGGSRFKSGLCLCWMSLLVLPVGLLAIGGGPCAGPRNSQGSAILLTVGVCRVAAAGPGAIRVLTSMSAVQNLMRVWGALSVCSAGLGCFLGGVYLLVGFISLRQFFRH